MKEDLMSASIPVEQADVEESEWVTYMQELRLNYYNKFHGVGIAGVRTRILVAGCRFIPTQ
jgi:hypothetical protein